MDNDKALPLPQAVLISALATIALYQQLRLPGGEATCYTKQLDHMLFKLKERNIRNAVGPSPGNIQVGH